MIKRNNLLWIVAGLVILWIFYYSFSGTGSDPNYVLAIEQGRRDKDQSFEEDPDSPFEGIEFTGLKYYPVDPKYRLQASIERFQNPERIFLETNDRKQQQYERFALAHFTLDGNKLQLVIFRVYPSQDKEQFFLPFGDQTSAIETYGAGRYLDLNFKPGSSRIELDFNLAYSPHCAYNPTFSCPLPPTENLLDVPVYSGEKNYD